MLKVVVFWSALSAGLVSLVGYLSSGILNYQ